jgi:hypothetical protein
MFWASAGIAAAVTIASIAASSINFFTTFLLLQVPYKRRLSFEFRVTSSRQSSFSVGPTVGSLGF